MRVKTAFPNIQVYPALGNHDYFPVSRWREPPYCNWLLQNVRPMSIGDKRNKREGEREEREKQKEERRKEKERKQRVVITCSPLTSFLGVYLVGGLAGRGRDENFPRWWLLYCTKRRDEKSAQREEKNRE
jgi:hypothetical protein